MESNDIPAQRSAKIQWFGVVSLTLGVVASLGGCLLTPLAATLALGGGEFGFTAALFVIVCLQAVVGILNLAGLVFGILALVRKESGKVKAVAGLLLNAMFVCASMFILWNSIPLLVKILNIH